MNNTRKGSIFVYVMVLMVLLTSFVSFATNYTLGYNKESSLRILLSDLRGAADVEIKNTINELKNDTDLYYTIPYESFIPLRQKTYGSYNVTVLGAANNGSENIHLRAIATTNINSRIRATKIVEVLLVVETQENIQTLFTQGLFADEGFKFMGAASAEYYDSDTSTSEDVPTILASNGFVTVQKKQNVDGNVESNLDLDMPALSITVPSGAVPLNQINNKVSLGAGVYSSTGIDGGSFHISGQVSLYVNGNLNLKSSIAVTYADEDSRLTIYHTGQEDSMSMAGNSFAGGNDPSQFILMTDYEGEVKLTGNGDFSGLFFAPNADFSMKGTFTMDGAMIAKSFGSKVNGTYNFLYDTELGNIEVDVPVIDIIDFTIEEYGSR